jgi:hypothetical protein
MDLSPEQTIRVAVGVHGQRSSFIRLCLAAEKVSRSQCVALRARIAIQRQILPAWMRVPENGFDMKSI